MVDKFDGTRQARSNLFQIWFQLRESWSATTEFVEVVEKTKSSILRKTSSFKKRKDLIKEYTDAAKVDRIISAKRRDGLWRRDPDLPEDEDEDMFWCEDKVSL